MEGGAKAYKPKLLDASVQEKLKSFGRENTFVFIPSVVVPVPRVHVPVAIVRIPAHVHDEATSRA